MPGRSTPKTLSPLDTKKLRKFADGLKGHLLLPADGAYESIRWSWNRAVDRSPAMIVRCANQEDIRRAVDFARKNDLLVAVRGSGHSFASHSTCDDGMVIDLSLMKEIKIDSERRSASSRAQGRGIRQRHSSCRSGDSHGRLRGCRYRGFYARRWARLADQSLWTRL
jgi:hypothetical protein